MLEVTGVTVAYGSMLALEDVDVGVGKGEIVAMVGHNGAGKTTLLRAVSGLKDCASGTISFDGQSLLGMRPEAVARRSIAYVPQGRNIFADLTVADNLSLVGEASGRAGISVEDILGLFPVLLERRSARAGSLSGGQQQMLALSLALVRSPRLILLDEPSTGLAPVLVQAVFETVRQLNQKLGTAFLIVDQNIDQVLSLASRAYVIKAGRVVYSGSAQELKNSDLWSFF